MRVRAAATLALTLCAVASACGPAGMAPATLALGDLESLRGERSDWRAPPDGVAWLHRSVRLVVDVSTDPSRAQSELYVRAVKTRFGARAVADRPDEELVAFVVPKGATPTSYAARWILPGAIPTAGGGDVRPDGTQRAALVTSRGVPSPGPVDPGAWRWEFRFAQGPAGAMLEVAARFEVDGTLPVDARPLGQADGPTRELLVRADVPGSATGTLRVVGWDRGKAPAVLTTSVGGTTIHALRLTDVPKAVGPAPYVRYVTERATPRGFRQLYSPTWARATGGYTAALVGASERVREGYPAPLRPVGETRDARIRAAAEWVRDRLQRDDAMAAGWAASAPLPAKVTANDLTQTDKVHLMAWILAEAGLPFSYAIGRGAAFPALAVDQPTPGGFDTPLMWVPLEAGGGLWLDPACRECAVGEVRPALRGGQAIRLPAQSEQPEPLPGG